MKNIEKARKYFVEEIEQNELMNRKPKKVFTTLNYIEYFLISVSAVNGCILSSVFSPLLGIPVGIRTSAIWLKICAITAEIEKYKSITKKNKKSMIK